MRKEKQISIISSLSIDKTKGSISSKYWDNNYLYKMKNLKNNFKEVKSYRCIGFEYIDIAINLLKAIKLTMPNDDFSFHPDQTNIN